MADTNGQSLAQYRAEVGLTPTASRTLRVAMEEILAELFGKDATLRARVTSSTNEDAETGNPRIDRILALDEVVRIGTERRMPAFVGKRVGDRVVQETWGRVLKANGLTRKFRSDVLRLSHQPQPAAAE